MRAKMITYSWKEAQQQARTKNKTGTFRINETNDAMTVICTQEIERLLAHHE